MEIPGAERTENTRDLGEGPEELVQPSVSRHEAGGAEVAELQQHPEHQAGGIEGVEEEPVEIESGDSSRAEAGVSSSSSNEEDNVNTNLRKAVESGASSSSSRNDIVNEAGPSSVEGGTAEVGGGGGDDVGIRIIVDDENDDDDDDSAYRLDEGRRRSTGAEGGSHDLTVLKEEDPPPQQETSDSSTLEASTASGEAEAGVADTTDSQSFRPYAHTFIMPTGFPSLTQKTDDHFIDIPLRMSSKVEELDGFKRFGIARTLSNFSRTSFESATGDQCRICQHHTEEPLMELGCHCRGELAKAHRSCVDHWFGNKGTNKCEVCQHVASNVPLPSTQPSPHFWVWRVGGSYNTTSRRGGGVGPYRLNPVPMRPVLLMTLRRHPIILLLWLLLFAFMAYLFVDVTDSTSIGYAAMPIGFLFGVLVVLGLGTAARLVLDCWHERIIRRNIRRMEEESNFEDFPPEPTDHISISTDPAEGGQSTSVDPSPAPGRPELGAAEASVTASVAAAAAPDVDNR